MDKKTVIVTTSVVAIATAIAAVFTYKHFSAKGADAPVDTVTDTE